MSFNKADAFKVASKYVQQGRLQAAIDEYRKLLRTEPNNSTVLNLLGDLYVKVGNKTEAINCFSRIADIYRQQDSHSKAIAILKKALKVEPDNPEIACKLGSLYAKENLWGEARQQYLAAAERYLLSNRVDEALNIYQRIVEQDPERAGVQIKLAEAYLRANQPELAYQAFVEAANDLQQQGRQEESLKIYLQALKARPEAREALSAAINIYLQRAETLPAETLLKSLLRSQPEDTELQSLLRRVNQMANDLKLAKHAISQAVEQDSTCVQYQVDLVSSSDRACATFLTAASEHQRQGNHEEALQAYLKALKIKPESQAATSAAVNLYLQQDDTRAAIMLLRHLLRARPNDAELLSLLAQVYYQAKDYDATEQTIGRALVLNPACYQEVLDMASLWAWSGELERALRLLDFIAGTLRERSEEDKAVTLLQEIVARDANHLGALERLVAIYERANDTPQLIVTLTTLAHAAIYQTDNGLALKALQRLAQLEPDEVWHQRLLQKIQSEAAAAQEEEAAIALPAPETTWGEVELEPNWEKNSEAEARAEVYVVVPEESVTYFPEYQSLNASDASARINSEPTNQPRQAAKGQEMLKDLGQAPKPAKLKPTITPQPASNTTQPASQAASAVIDSIAWHWPTGASEQTSEKPRGQATEAVETTATNAPSEVLAETSSATAATNPASNSLIIVSVGLSPRATSSMTVWRRTRPMFKRKEESPLVNPRSRSRTRKRLPRR